MNSGNGLTLGRENPSRLVANRLFRQEVEHGEFGSKES